MGVSACVDTSVLQFNLLVIELYFVTSSSFVGSVFLASQVVYFMSTSCYLQASGSV